jgi:hypothetical protein
MRITKTSKMKLRELAIGDRFIHAYDKSRKHRFTVVGNCTFNPFHGTSTRNCKADNGELLSKSCNLKIIKLPIA